ncbi:hypothetical protein GQ43DRAFT_455970 [Delitschia confertaspora ATCC 74209]|uniref:Ubiquitin-conjugating enzyme E2-binding protein n=1 Tax=Delitschia confertaspora ATCC 74209 TaxID=1513339 RepID=A0A9P4JQ85_9PLEO|nr:hypothetical protein GQ43DRAFT_455970 [Delitschia confertaspora ATCC 74209]
MSSTLPESAFAELHVPPDTVKAVTDVNDMTPTDTTYPPSPSTPSNGSDTHSSIALYAELLLHIRTITLFASLHTLHNRETKALFSADGTSLTISHEGESASVQLPAKIKRGGTATIALPAAPQSKEISLRLQVEEDAGGLLRENEADAGEREANPVPWGGLALDRCAKDFGVRVVCKSCHKPLLKEGSVKEWRDLPNENWAEMMDFWHCHKPEEHHENGHSHGSGKGYAAGNRLRAERGKGFVDVVSLLLHEENCEGVKKPQTESKESTKPILLCNNCNVPLGFIDKLSEGYRLHKWATTIFPASAPSPPPPLHIQKWIAARFLSLIENQGVRKFNVHAEQENESQKGGEKPELLLWIFTPDLFFSSSNPSPSPSYPRHDPTRAMKVFFRYRNPSFDGSNKGESASIEDVYFPKDVVAELTRSLRKNQSLLPGKARQFQGWEVGLLERFGRTEVGL